MVTQMGSGTATACLPGGGAGKESGLALTRRHLCRPVPFIVATMPLVLAVHTVASPSANVPFAVILLQDHITNRKVPVDMKCRQVRRGWDSASKLSSVGWAPQALLSRSYPWNDMHHGSGHRNTGFCCSQSCRVIPLLLPASLRSWCPPPAPPAPVCGM